MRILIFFTAFLLVFSNCGQHTQNQQSAPLPEDKIEIEISEQNSDDIFLGEINYDIQEVEIRITEDGFEPAEISVPRGSFVRWINYANEAHDVRSEAGTGSEPLEPGDSYEHQFNNSGVFPYFCSMHPDKRGNIIVE